MPPARSPTDSFTTEPILGALFSCPLSNSPISVPSQCVCMEMLVLQIYNSPVYLLFIVLPRSIESMLRVGTSLPIMEIPIFERLTHSGNALICGNELGLGLSSFLRDVGWNR